MRKAWRALMAAGAVSAAFAMPAVAREFPYCIKGCDFGAGAGDCSFSSLAQCQATASGRVALQTPISTPRRTCRPIAAANPEGDSDAHSGFGNFGDWNGLRFSAGAGPDLRFGLSGLPACLRPGQLL